MTDRSKIQLPQILIIKRCIIKCGEEYLIMKRTNCTFDPGKWEFPGGKFALGDKAEKNLQTEVKEETGLKLRIPPGLSYIETRRSVNPKYKGVPILLIFYMVNIHKKPKIKISDEHSEFAWVTRSEMRKYECSRGTIEAVEAFSQRDI